VQIRQALDKVLTAGVGQGDYDVPHAIEIAKKILFLNSNRIYHLRFDLNSILAEKGASIDINANRSKVLKKNGKGLGFEWGNPATDGHDYNVAKFDTFIAKNGGVKYVRVQWLDFTAMLKARILPIAEFRNMIKTGGAIGLTLASSTLMQNDNTTINGR
jgi:hypothetical protein